MISRRLAVLTLILALGLLFPALAASRTVSVPPPRDPDLAQATALADKGDCEGARKAFLAAAADLGPMFVGTVRASFGEPCTLREAKDLPRALKAVALAEQGKQAQASLLFLSLVQEGSVAGAEMSMEFPLVGNASNPNPVSGPEMAKAREDYCYWRDDEALPVIRRYADQGDPMACYLMADFLSSGPGSEKNAKKEIADWYERAAEKGSSRALVFLADFYQKGEGRPRDPEKADALLRQAVDQGDGHALYEMHRLLAEENGDKLTPMSIYYLGQAAHQGFPWAMYVLARLLEHNGRPESMNRYVYWYAVASETGLPEACLKMGLMYEHGWGLPQDQKKAARYFQLAARSHKVPQALFHLAHMYAEGRGAPKDRLKAAFSAHQAARFGLKEAESLETELESRLTPEEQDQIRVWHGEWKASPPGPWVMQ